MLLRRYLRLSPHALFEFLYLPLLFPGVLLLPNVILRLIYLFLRPVNLRLNDPRRCLSLYLLPAAGLTCIGTPLAAPQAITVAISAPVSFTVPVAVSLAAAFAALLCQCVRAHA